MVQFQLMILQLILGRDIPAFTATTDPNPGLDLTVRVCVVVCKRQASRVGLRVKPAIS